MAGLADGLLAYTTTNAATLQILHPKSVVRAAPNALYHAHDLYYSSYRQRNSFIYVGRLVPEKKVDLAVRAFAIAQRARPEIELVIIGDGPQRDQLGRLVEETGAVGVSLLPYDDDRESLRKHYAKALASLSPGYVGLSAIQSFGFGVPMIVADDEPHSPEIEAVRDGVNALFFRSGDVEALASQMIRVAEGRAELAEGPSIAAAIAETYTVEAMATGILDIVQHFQGRAA